MTPVVVFRCDGGVRVGAGHVARCLQVALAYRAGGGAVLFAGAYDGLAAKMLSHARVDVTGEVPADAGAVIVDSYEIAGGEVEALARRLPVAVVSDGGQTPAGAVVLDYHPDAVGACLTGPAYAPVPPACIGARRRRGFERALVAVGGGQAGGTLREAARAVLWRHGLELLEPAGAPGLQEQLHAADVAVSAAGVTAYELVCAGVPAALVPVAENQQRVAESFAARGLALSGRGVGDLVEQLADGRIRHMLAASGPAVVDGYGAFRVRDGLRAAFAGRAPPEVLLYRPAGPEDADRQLRWRNDPDVRAASWQTEEVSREAHERWFADVLSHPLRTLLMIEADGGPVGSIRFDGRGVEAEISVMVDAERRGGGSGSKAIRETSELFLTAYPGLERIRAELREDNSRSAGAFRRAGFVPAVGEHPEGRLVLTLDRAGLVGGAQSDR